MDNTLRLPCEVGKVSDGYHTFDELYEHRCLLMCCLAQTQRAIAFRTRRDNKGEQWEGWFILGLNLPFGQVTYHIPERLWALTDGIAEIEYNRDYDGHTGADVCERLAQLARALAG